VHDAFREKELHKKQLERVHTVPSFGGLVPKSKFLVQVKINGIFKKFLKNPPKTFWGLLFTSSK
jgi:hypothetical protein